MGLCPHHHFGYSQPDSLQYVFVFFFFLTGEAKTGHNTPDVVLEVLHVGEETTPLTPFPHTY